MTCRVSVKIGENRYRSFFLQFAHHTFEVIDVDGVCYIECYKIHDHLYRVYCFFYKNKIIDRMEFRGLKEMCGAIQKLLDENL